MSRSASQIITNNDDYLFFNSFQHMSDFIELRKNDKKFIDSVNSICVVTEQQTITIDNYFFDKFTNLTYISLLQGNVTLAKNSLSNLQHLNTIIYNNCIPNLEYLGITNYNILRNLQVSTMSCVDENFFNHSFDNLRELSISSRSFSGECFKAMPALVILRINYTHRFYPTVLNNFKLHSLTLKYLAIAQKCATNKFDIYIPNVKNLVSQNSDLCNNIVSTSHRLVDVACYDSEFHISALFSQNNLKFVDIENNDLCDENIYGFKNCANLILCTVENNKIVRRDLPNYIINKILIV